MAQESLLEPPLVVHTRPVIKLDDEQLYEFCQINQDLRIERGSDGDIIIMYPEGGSSGIGSAKLTLIFGKWAERDGRGEVFGPSTGFILPNGAMRAPDVAWVRKKSLDALTDKQWKRFLPLCPDFVLELRSPSDTLRSQQKKMEEYRQNGAQLGWLLDPPTREVHVYQPGAAPRILDNPLKVSGAPLLRGFVLKLAPIWAAIDRKKA